MSKIETQEINDKDVHDFRKDKCRWGWNGLDFEIINKIKGKQTAKMKGIGRGIKQGQYILSTHGKQDVIWKITWIAYNRNPSDMFSADLKYAGIPAE